MRFLKDQLWWVACVAAVVLALAVGLLPGRADALSGPPSSQVRPAAAAAYVNVRTPTVNGLRLRATPGYHGRVKGLVYPGDVLIGSGGRDGIRGPWVWVAIQYKNSRGGLRRGSYGWVYRGYTGRMDIWTRR